MYFLHPAVYKLAIIFKHFLSYGRNNLREDM